MLYTVDDTSSITMAGNKKGAHCTGGKRKHKKPAEKGKKHKSHKSHKSSHKSRKSKK